MKTDHKELQEICDLIRFSKSNRGVKRYLNFGLLPEDVVSKALLKDIDLTDFRLFIDTSGINHTLNGHGFNSIVRKNGEVPICILDFIFLKFDVLEFDHIEENEDAIIFYKNKVRHLKVIVCEARVSNKKGKRLYLKTMYNKKRL